MTLTVALLLKLIIDLQATCSSICNSMFLEKWHTWLHGIIGVKWRVNIMIEILSLGINSVQCEKVKETAERFSKMTLLELQATQVKSKWHMIEPPPLYNNTKWLVSTSRKFDQRKYLQSVNIFAILHHPCSFWVYPDLLFSSILVWDYFKFLWAVKNQKSNVKTEKVRQQNTNIMGQNAHPIKSFKICNW